MHGRFWWLPGADTASLRTAIDDVFDRYDVETIAPGFGCILHGAGVVAHHRKLLDAALRQLGEEPSIGRSVAHWPLRERTA